MALTQASAKAGFTAIFQNANTSQEVKDQLKLHRETFRRAFGDDAAVTFIENLFAADPATITVAQIDRAMSYLNGLWEGLPEE